MGRDSVANKLFLPGMKHHPVIGVIGGGQLGRMFIEEAQRYEVDCIIADADKNCPASGIATRHIVGSISAREPILALAAACDVLTYEIEHIFVDTLLELEAKGTKLIPSPGILRMVQDKGLQKTFFRENNIPTSDFEIVNSPSEWLAALDRLKCKKIAAKLCREGYDGKGVSILRVQDIRAHPESIPFQAPSVLEQFISCEKELSVIVARDAKGKVACYPCVEMEFDEKANLVKYLLSPARINRKIRNKAAQIATRLVKKMNGVGLFAVEMFLDKKGNVLVNEVAPRPHNSGHHTIEACYTSQYEQLLRIVLGLPLGSTRQLQPAVMLNLLGPEGLNGPYRLEGMEELLKIEGVYVHLYHKQESRPMRKLGHITILGNSVKEVKTKAARVSRAYRIVAA